jgi:hypothetical protein
MQAQGRVSHDFTDLELAARHVFAGEKIVARQWSCSKEWTQPISQTIVALKNE